MKPYEEIKFPSGIIRWTRENNLYVCRLTEENMDDIKFIHESEKDYSSYRTQRAILIEYLHVMIARNDWHGVADVAMDMRELEAENKQ
jgi:hypothetical protein